MLFRKYVLDKFIRSSEGYPELKPGIVYENGFSRFLDEKFK